MPVGIVGLGTYVPGQRITNEDIAHWSGVSPHWITERTGIHERRYAGGDETTSDLAAAAVQDALDRTGLDRERIGVLTVATTTPDQPQPATAVHVQRKAGLPTGAAFDINAVCSGFVYGLVTTAALLDLEPEQTRGVCVAADVFSRIMNRDDPRTVSLFGDGAGCAVLGAVPEGYGILGHALTADGSCAEYVQVPAGGTAMPTTEATLADGKNSFHMEGRNVKSYAATWVPKVCEEALAQAGVQLGDIDRVIFHQGNVRLVETLSELMGLRADQVFLTGDTFGNTAAASVPLTLAHSDSVRPLRRGDLVLLAAVGGGMTAGSVVMRWY